MDGPLICLAGFVLVVVLLLLRTPIAVSLGIVGLGGLALLLSPEAALIKSGVITFTTISHYELGVLPLFLFMAHVLFSAGVSTRLFDAAAKFVGHKPRRAGAGVDRRMRSFRIGERIEPCDGGDHGTGSAAGDAQGGVRSAAVDGRRWRRAARWAC